MYGSGYKFFDFVIFEKYVSGVLRRVNCLNAHHFLYYVLRRDLLMNHTRLTFIIELFDQK